MVATRMVGVSVVVVMSVLGVMMGMQGGVMAAPKHPRRVAGIAGGVVRPSTARTPVALHDQHRDYQAGGAENNEFHAGVQKERSNGREMAMGIIYLILSSIGDPYLNVARPRLGQFLNLVPLSSTDQPQQCGIAQLNDF